VATWYRALVDQLINQWEHVRAAMASGRCAGERAALTHQAAQCAVAFSRLAQFTRHHERNQLVRT